MKIAFLLGWPGISGGANVIYEHASGLVASGHQVFLITQSPVDDAEMAWHPSAERLPRMALESAEKEAFDVAIATWWESPFLLHRIKSSHFLYFVQSIESRFWPPDNPADHDQRTNSLGRALAESTYTLNVPIITEARWIREYLHTHFNHWAFLVPNGINKSLFSAEGPKIAAKNAGLRVLVEGPVDVFHKNVPKTVELCRQAGIEEIWLLTSSPISTFTGVDRVFSGVPIVETAAIYRSCDLLVKLSYIEGMFGPPLEMFHCGGTALVYDVTGHDEYIVHDRNGYVVAKDDEASVIQYLQYLARHPEDLKRLQQGAAETAGQWPDWSQATAQFAEALSEIIQMPQVCKEYLRQWTERMHHEYVIRRHQRELERFQRREQGVACPGDRDNFIQVYYRTEGESFSDGRMRWAQYQGSEQIEAKIVVPVTTGLPFWLRIDPSLFMGVITLDALTVIEQETDRLLFACKTVQEFTALVCAGTARPIKTAASFHLLSYGEDPQLVLPPLIAHAAEGMIEVTVRLQECSISDFLHKEKSSGLKQREDRVGTSLIQCIKELIR